MHASRLRIATLVAIALVWYAAQARAAGPIAPSAMSAAERLPGGGVNPRIVNGVFTSAYPSVGALLTPGSTLLGGLLCSGTLIGCQTFLTAGHCVCDFTGADCQSGPRAPNPADYIVFFQHAGFFTVSSISVRTDFNFPVGDVAVLTLATPVTGIAPTPIDGTAAPAFGASATIVGFGRDAGASDYGLKRAGSVTMAPCTSGISDQTSVCWDFANPLGAPGTDSDTCNGDSGGPLFASFQCGDTVAGTTSGGTSATCLPTDHSYDANVFTYHAYIAAQAGADLDNASCGAMPQAGEAGAPIVAATGTLDSGTTQAVHSFTVPAGTTRLRIAMNASEENGADFDLYVRAGSVPTTSTFDCKADGSNQYGFCEFTSPAAGTWYALVNRFTGSGSYQVTATTFASGGPGSGTEGDTCDDGNVCTSGDSCTRGTCGGAAVANGTPCDDGRVCTSPDTCSGGVCVSQAAPATGCIQPIASGKASLVMRNAFPDTRDNLTWRWLKGGATTLADFGQPNVGDDLELCLFDESAGVPALKLDTKIPAGPLWTPTSHGFRYTDRSLTNGGIRSITLKDGLPGAAAITLKAKGDAVAPPALPLSQDPSVRVQLVGPHACWEATYSTNRVNDGQQFKAKGD
jgi:hypothetical protein